MRRWRPPNITWFDLAVEWDILICDGKNKCRKQWSANTHRLGRVDSMGYLHWDGWNRRPYRNGLRKFLKWVALCKWHPRDEPAWLRLYRTNVTANLYAKRYHVTFWIDETRRDRLETRRLAKQAGLTARDVRRINRNAYNWMWRR